LHDTNTPFVVAIRFGLHWFCSVPQAFIEHLLYEARGTKKGKGYESKSGVLSRSVGDKTHVFESEIAE